MTNSTYTKDVAKPLTLKDIEEAYKSIKSEKIVEKVIMRPDYFQTVKEQTKPETLPPIYGIPVIVDPELKVPFRFIYKGEFDA